jgi:steroid 5-alpha reductase family enzyme
LTTLVFYWGVAAAMMLLAWLVQRRSGDAGVVDLCWTFGVGGLALFSAVSFDGEPQRRLLLALMGGLWSGRLLWHLARRSGPEDGRYGALRREWGPKAQLYFFFFFQFQAVLVLFFTLPFWLLSQRQGPLGLADAAAGGLWLVAWSGESLADRQLRRFKALPDNRARTCRAGLWRYSRHPNYFFEWLQWTAYGLMGLGGEQPWLPFMVAAGMLFLILRVTGVPYTEKRALAGRGEDYRRYQRSTSVFFPWFPRKDKI